MSLSLGDLVESRYRVEALLGEGASSRVYRAFDQHIQNTVVLKVFRNSDNLLQDGLSRFEQEAKILSQLEHPGIVRVFRYGFLDNGSPYIAMEHLSGKTLRDLLIEKQSFKCNEALALAEKLADAMSFAHLRNVIHRDLKPENIIIEEKQPKILDFGLSKVLDEEARRNANRTSTVKLAGTPAYMSPEQCLGKGVDERSDIYAFGCIVFEMLAGYPPFRADSAAETMMMQINEPPPKLSKLIKGSVLPRRFDEFIAKCLAKKKEERYQSFAELLPALKSLVDLDISENFCVSPAKSEGKARKGGRFCLYLILALLIVVPLLLPEKLKIKFGLASPEIETAGIIDRLNSELSENKLDAANALVEKTLNSEAFLAGNAERRESLLTAFFDSYLKHGEQDQAFKLGCKVIESVFDREVHGFRKIGFGDEKQLSRNAFVDQMNLTYANRVCRGLMHVQLSTEQWQHLQAIYNKRPEVLKIHSPFLRDLGLLKVKANENGHISESCGGDTVVRDYLYILHVLPASPSADELKIAAEMQKKLLAFSKRNGNSVEKECYSYIILGRAFLRAGDLKQAGKQYEVARDYALKYGQSSLEEEAALRRFHDELVKAGCKP